MGDHVSGDQHVHEEREPGSLGENSVNGTRAGRASGDARALVPTVIDAPDGEYVTADELAKAMRVSRATIDRKRRRGELPAIETPHGYRYVRTTVEVGSRPRAPSAIEREQYEGDRDARVFSALRRGATISEIVEQEHIPASVVMQIRDTWLAAAAADRKGVAYVCACGAPSHPATARCMACHERTRVLSDDQLATLAGREPPPVGTCTCRGCGQRVEVDRSEHLCRGCEGQLAIVSDNGFLAVALGGRVVRRLSADEMRALAPHVAHWVPQQTPVAPEIPRAESVPKGTSAAAVVDMLRTLLTPDPMPEDNNE